MGLWGFGVTGGGTITFGPVGSGQGSVGIGIFGNGWDPSSWNIGVTATFGGYIAPDNGYPPQTGPDQAPWAVGMYGGAGLNGFLTNATSAEELGGPFSTFGGDAAFGDRVVSVQYAVTPQSPNDPNAPSGPWFFGLGPPPAPGGGLGAGAYSYNTNTAATTLGCLGDVWEHLPVWIYPPWARGWN
jgi:hypothetical protein